jgi:hypothetical protein
MKGHDSVVIARSAVNDEAISDTIGNRREWSLRLFR